MYMHFILLAFYFAAFKALYFQCSESCKIGRQQYFCPFGDSCASSQDRVDNVADWSARRTSSPVVPGSTPVLTLVLFHGRLEFESSAMLLNSQLVCLRPVGILNNVIFNFKYVSVIWISQANKDVTASGGSVKILSPSLTA